MTPFGVLGNRISISSDSGFCYYSAMNGIELTRTSDGPVLIFSGNMDQNFKFPDPASLRESKIVMDFNALKLINSLGVRSFIQFTDGLSGSELIYRNCPTILVNQFNMVKSMVTSRVRIESFYAPYFAPITEEELELLITPDEIQKGKAPKRFHPESEEQLEFDDLEERYFFFLSP